MTLPINCRKKILNPLQNPRPLLPLLTPVLPRALSPCLSREMKKKISITVQDAIPLQSVFMELGRLAGVGIALSPQTSASQKGVTYRAHETPFIDIVKDICHLTQHRFNIQGNRLLVEPDTPYLMTYPIHFLNQVRKSENRISVSTDAFSPLETKQHADNGSHSILSSTSSLEFWSELENNLRMILGAPSKGAAPYTLHKQGGLITVSATSEQHSKLCDYFQKLKATTSTQVIIEAKIIEVTLHDAYKTGINWHQFVGLTTSLGPLAGSYTTGDFLSFSLNTSQFTSILNLVKTFGTVRTLSNPRLTVMNNQPAMLKVATNEVFFQLEFERLYQAEGKPDIENVSSHALTVPIGLVMIVQPSVNLHTGEITMTLRPTVSRVQKEVEDPAVAIKSQHSVKSTIPVVQVRELDSVLKMKSGQILVMGGLMEDRASSSSASVPGIEEVPLLGDLTQGKEDERKITELVIFLSATIVDAPSPQDADKRLYNTYVEDPRPLCFGER